MFEHEASAEGRTDSDQRCDHDGDDEDRHSGWVRVLYPFSRNAMSARASVVTKIIVHACVFAVRRAWVPFSVERNQSQKPVSAASTDTAAPPMNR